MVPLTFSVTDSGELDESLNIPIGEKLGEDVIIAPEVVHLSRFAESYKLHRDSDSPTKASLCRHNSSVANTLRFDAVSRMWNILATLLEGCGTDNLATVSGNSLPPNNAMSYLLPSTLRTLFLQRCAMSA